MPNRKLSIAAAILLPLLAAAYVIHSWGIYHYLISVVHAPAPSPNSKKSAGTLMFKPFKKGEALLIHGLNFDADKLLPAGMLIHQAGFQVTIPRLAGHRGILSETFGNPVPAWQGQFEEFNRGFNAPGVCAGYSMGGLLVVERFLAGKLNCASFVLFAPAFATYTPDFGADFLRWILPERFQVRSGIPGDYKHFDHLGLGPTWGVVDVLRDFKKLLRAADTKKTPPGLVFIDPRDRVVNAPEVRRTVREYFPHWRIVDVEALPLEESHAFHMIIDEPHVGATQWAAMAKEIGAFLKQ